MTVEYAIGDLNRQEWLSLLGIASADDPKLAALAALSWGGNALTVLQVNATANGWQFAALAAVATSGDAADLSGTLSNLRLAAFTGDATKPAGSGVLTLATVNSNTGTYGGAATSPQFSVDGKGRITGVSAVTITPAYTNLVSVPTARFLGRSTPGTGAAEALTASQARALLGFGAANYSTGTTFPGSPVTDDICYRTDRRIEYFYDGARWLSTEIFTLAIQPSDFTLPITDTKSFGFRTSNPWAGLYDIYALEGIFARYITGVSSWTYGITRSTNAATATVTSTTAAADALNVWVNSTRVAINAVITSANNAFDGFATRNSGAASCYPLFSMTYRLVG